MKPTYCNRERPPSPSELARQEANKHLHFLLRAAINSLPVLYNGKYTYINVFRCQGGEAEIYLVGNPEAIAPEFITVAPTIE